MKNDALFYWNMDYHFDPENIGPVDFYGIDSNIYMPGINYGHHVNTQLSEDIYAAPYEPSKTSAPEEAPTHSTPAITVNSVTVKPAVPVWVWIALGCTLIATSVLLFFLGVRRSRKEAG